jgi:hypothetical protein
MDNILKLLLGVLALSGAIAFLVPSQSPVAPPVDTATPAAAPPATPTEEVFEDEEDGDIEGDDDEGIDGEESDEDDFIMGEPSIDGQPFGGNNSAPVDPSTSMLNRMDNPQQQQPASAPAINNGNVVL